MRILTFLLLTLFLYGCTNEQRLPFSGNQLSGYLFKEEECTKKPCNLAYTGDFIFNVNEQSQRIIYKLEIKMRENIKQIYVGELKNCRVFSVTEFQCDGLINNMGNLKFPIRYEDLSVNKPDDFEKIDAMSDSFAAYLASFAGFFYSNRKQDIENYDNLAYFLAFIAVFLLIS